MVTTGMRRDLVRGVLMVAARSGIGVVNVIKANGFKMGSNPKIRWQRRYGPLCRGYSALTDTRGSDTAGQLKRYEA